MDGCRSVLCPLRVSDHWNPARYPRPATLVAKLYRTSRVTHFSPVLRCPNRPLCPPAAARALVRAPVHHFAGESDVVLDLHGKPAHRLHAGARDAARHGAPLVAVDRGAVLPDLAALCVGVQTAVTATSDRAHRHRRACLSPRSCATRPYQRPCRILLDAGSPRWSHDRRGTGSRRPDAGWPDPD